MATIVVETRIRAPIELCFDLARDVGAHAESAAFSSERVVEPGRTQGLLELGDLVAFEGRHFGITQRFVARIQRFTANHGYLGAGCEYDRENSWTSSKPNHSTASLRSLKGATH